MPRIGKAEARTDTDQQLVKALAHPVRAEALTILNARIASPNEIAKELEVHVGNVSYHVNELKKLGCVELVKTEPRRGATEHFYRGVARKYLDDGFWGRLSHNVRNGISLTAIRVLVGAVRDAVTAGTFDQRKDRHASVITYNLDERAWEEARDLYESTLDTMMEIGARAEGRLARGEPEGEGPGLRATFGLLAFESPVSHPPRGLATAGEDPAS
jgi:DNA-binding transcriptional ArsR family regulator